MSRIIHITISCWLLSLILAGSVNAEPVTLLFGGDVLLAHHLDYFMDKYGPDYPFQRLKAQISAADIAFCNQEAPIATKGKRVSDKTFTFRCRPTIINALKGAGFDIVNLANNHAGDFGDEALVETMQLLCDANFAYCGAGKNLAEAAMPAVLECKGLKFAFHGYSKTYPFSFFATKESPGTLGGDLNQMLTDLADSVKQSDVQIVSVHWGAELMTTPKAYQRVFAHRAIEAGADLVIGHHPHVLQGFEYYQGKLIAYSLGNLAFASYSRNVKDSALLTVTVEGDNIIEAELTGLDVYNPRVDMQPRYLSVELGTQLMSYLDGLSRKLGAQVETLPNGRGRVRPL